MKKVLALLMAACVAISPVAYANSDAGAEGSVVWPNTKNVRWLIGASAGGATDLNFKALTSQASKYTDANIVPEYINGGGGTVMQTQLMTEDTDGSVIATLAVGSALVKPWTNDLPYTPDDFTFVAGYTVTQSFLVVNADFPADTWEEFVEEVKANPGKYTYSQGSVGGIGHVQTAAMLQGAGILNDTVMISYDSGGEAVLALVGGHVDFTVASPGEIAQYVEEGSMKVLLLGGTSRSETWPDVPCAEEYGYPAIDSRGVICAPPGMDPEMVEAMSNMIKTWLEDPDVQETFATMGQAIEYVDSATITEECHELYNICGELLPELGFTLVR